MWLTMYNNKCYVKMLSLMEPGVYTTQATTYNAYCKAQEAVERVIKYQDLVDHLPEFHSMTLQIQQSETNFQNRTLEIDKTHPKITRGWCPYLRFW